MPAYEHLDDAGEVVERSITFEGTPLDVQMRAAASDPASGWYVAQTADAPRHKLTETPPVPTPAAPSASDGPTEQPVAEPASPAPSTLDATAAVVGEPGPEPTDLPPGTEVPAAAPEEQ